MDTLVTQYINYLQHERHASAYTIASYQRDLRLFITFAHLSDSSLTWTDIDSDLIRDWMEEMMDRGCAATTVNRRLSSLRALFRYALKQGLVRHDPAYHVRGPKKSKPLPAFVQEKDMDRLLASSHWTDSFDDLRARTIILTFYSTGMRLAELLALDDSAIDFHASQLKVHGKRNKDRIIPFGSELHDALTDYIAHRDETLARTTTALFVNNKGQRMRDYQVRRLVQTALAHVTTMKKRSPHVLRHTFATAMLNNDAHLESIKTLLGHESVSTTEIYTHTTFEQLRRVYDNTHPRGTDHKDKKD